MCFSEEKFLKCVDAINKTNYNYGNEVLYRSCGFTCLEDSQKLSSAIWLIGKSYSADPTRSAPKDTFKNKGLGSSFESIAKKLFSSEKYTVFRKELSKLEKYTYTDISSDLKTLEKTVDLVNTLNEMIKDAMTEIDPKNRDSDNVVSFCSKFLHFMCPHLFFIIDSYSRNGGHTLFSTRANARTLYIRDQKNHPQNMTIDNTAKKYFHDNYSFSFEPSVSYDENAINDYRDHCLRAYGLARFLNENGKTCEPQIKGDDASCYMPRLVDSILMRITD